MRRFAVELRSSIASILRAIDIEGALLIFAVGGAAVLGYTVEWRVAVLVLVIAAALAAVIFARAPRDR